MSLFDLTSKRALVTGANAGIGQAIAVELAKAGAEVVCAGRLICDETLTAIGKAGGTGKTVQLDFADPMAGNDAMSDLGPLDILVNNAGIIRREDSVEFSEEDWGRRHGRQPEGPVLHHPGLRETCA